MTDEVWPTQPLYACAEPAPYPWLERDCWLLVDHRTGRVRPRCPTIGIGPTTAESGYRRRTRQMQATRWIWERRHGPIPDGLWVLHHCDNAPCIEDSHHYLGDALDNRRDRQEREAPWPGPYPRGECDVCGYESTVNALARHRNRTGH